MTNLFLKFSLLFIGIAGVSIGLSFIVFGVNNTGKAFNSVLHLFYDAGPLSGLGNPNAESELRFYSVFWTAYGALLIQSTLDTKYSARIPWLIGLFFAGGVARLLALLSSGTPHALFILLMMIELILPPIIFSLWVLEKRRHET